MGKGLKVLAERWQGCQRCKLGKERERQEIVFGLGKPTAKYLLIYDTPTEIDVHAALPMAGSEGDLLAALVEQARIKLEDVYCTPLLGCRPTVLLPETGSEPARLVDRAPVAEELNACAPRWKELIYRLDPLVIFTLGADPFAQLVRGPDRGKYKALEKAIGELFITRVPGRWIPEVTYDVIPLMSMKQIMAKPSHAAHGPLATTARHLHKGRAYAEFLIKTGVRDAAAAGFEEPGSVG